MVGEASSPTNDANANSGGTCCARPGLARDEMFHADAMKHLLSCLNEGPGGS